jgi:hypothetical protein
MIFKRAVARLRAQDWVAITIELAIVIIGVFIGIQVSNWNADRLDRRETQMMLTRLKPELRNILAIYSGARAYYGVTSRYWKVALAGWRRDPAVSDQDFVIAAYQASQIYSNSTNNATWATIFGADRLRTIDDPAIRTNLSYLMYADTTPISTLSMNTRYRENVRRIIPLEIQDAIRDKCGDRRPPDNPQLFYLEPECDLQIPPAKAAEAAARLRSHPELAEDLQWHVAAVASYLANMTAFETRTKTLESEINALD